METALVKCNYITFYEKSYIISHLQSQFSYPCYIGPEACRIKYHLSIAINEKKVLPKIIIAI